MKRPHLSLLSGLAICIVAAILVICKMEDNGKNRNASSAIFIGEGISSVEPNQLMNRDMPRSARRQCVARENLGVLSGLGYVLTADIIRDYTAKGKVKIIAPDGTILRSDSMSISSDGDNIILQGAVSVVSESGFIRGSRDADSVAIIALDGSSQSFIGVPLYEPGSTMKILTTSRQN